MDKKGTLLLVGTAKGLFILQRDAGGDKWKLDGPHFAGRAVYSAFYDDRKGRSDLWAGPVSWHFGAELVKSTDMGATWDAPERMRIKMPANTKKSLENILADRPGADADTLYVGVAPAALFESHDRGETWKLNSGLWKHPHRKKWSPGFGGFACTPSSRTVRTPKTSRSPSRPAGVYQSNDGGDNWQVTNTGRQSLFFAKPISRVRPMRHKIARHPKKKNTYFLQNHHGVYRSRDGAGHLAGDRGWLPSNLALA
jgi:hypothetical protein